MTVEGHVQNILLSPQLVHTENTIDQSQQQRQDIQEVPCCATTSLSPTAPKRRYSVTESAGLSPPIEINNTSKDLAITFSPFTFIDLTHRTACGLEEAFSAPSTPSSINPVLPLTTQNLERFSEASGDIASMDTPKKSSDRTSKLSKHIEDVRQILKLNDMLVQADGVLEAYPEIMASAEQLLENPRHSPPPTKEQLTSIQKTRKKYATRNETTFTNKFFGVFRSIAREVKVHQDDLQVPIGWEARDWEDDGLDENDDKLMRDGSVPKIVTLSETQKLILDDLPNISNPKPDILYGYDLESFTVEEALINARFKDIASVSEGIGHPFFDIEAKTHGDPEEAVNVACTGGAALVQAHRRLEALVASTGPKANGPTEDKPYADTSTMAYSMVISPRIASIYVHWAEVKGKQVVYHMHCAGSYGIERDKNLKECRTAVNNILDWGLSERRTAINGLLRTLYEHYKDAGKGVKGKGKSAETAGSSTDQPPANKKQRVEGNQAGPEKAS
ncbi:MAG: hypothetical protein LQ341_006746 [Variospora aurantia]|nr:MAG: hypothetical protein LQ341_006746 [Variospora aurantia]